jgi:hypothetical protein
VLLKAAYYDRSATLPALIWPQGRGREGTGRDATGGGGGGGTACGPEFDLITRAEIGGETEVDGCG